MTDRVQTPNQRFPFVDGQVIDLPPEQAQQVASEIGGTVADTDIVEPKSIPVVQKLPGVSRLLCLDVGGVLANKDTDDDYSHLEPLEGCKEFLEQLREHGVGTVVNSAHPVNEVQRWLQQYGLLDLISGGAQVGDDPMPKVVQHKPRAEKYLDDRMVRYKGDYEEALDAILDFRPWWADKDYEVDSVALDFDATLNVYGTTGTEDEFTDEPPPPQDGAREFVAKLYSKVGRLVIFSARPPDQIRKWIEKYDFDRHLDEVEAYKPKVKVYLDDRGIRFKGDYKKTLEKLRLLEPEKKGVAGGVLGTNSPPGNSTATPRVYGEPAVKAVVAVVCPRCAGTGHGTDGRECDYCGGTGEVQYGDDKVAKTAPGEKLDQEAAIVIVLNDEGKVLTVTRPDSDEQSLPGGLIDPGETASEAVVRELVEECGISPSDGVEEITRIESPVDGRKVHVFQAGQYNGSRKPRDVESAGSVEWMTPQELLDQAKLYRPSVEELLQHMKATQESRPTYPPPEDFGQSTEPRPPMYANGWATPDVETVDKDGAVQPEMTQIMGDKFGNSPQNLEANALDHANELPDVTANDPGVNAPDLSHDLRGSWVGDRPILAQSKDVTFTADGQKVTGFVESEQDGLAKVRVTAADVAGEYQAGDAVLMPVQKVANGPEGPGPAMLRFSDSPSIVGDIKVAYQEGYRSALEGESAEDNPYTMVGEPYKRPAWSSGWQDGAAGSAPQQKARKPFKGNPQWLTYSVQELQRMQNQFRDHLRDEERATGGGLRGEVASANVREFNRQINELQAAIDYLNANKSKAPSDLAATYREGYVAGRHGARREDSPYIVGAPYRNAAWTDGWTDAANGEGPRVKVYFPGIPEREPLEGEHPEYSIWGEGGWKQLAGNPNDEYPTGVPTDWNIGPSGPMVSKGLTAEQRTRARNVDLVVLPDRIEGTNCANCEHFSAQCKDQAPATQADFNGTGCPVGFSAGYCSHSEVEMNVMPHWCCAKWETPDTARVADMEGQKHVKTGSVEHRDDGWWYLIPPNRESGPYRSESEARGALGMMQIDYHRSKTAPFSTERRDDGWWVVGPLGTWNEHGPFDDFAQADAAADRLLNKASSEFSVKYVTGQQARSFGGKGWYVMMHYEPVAGPFTTKQEAEAKLRSVPEWNKAAGTIMPEGMVHSGIPDGGSY